LRDERGKSGTLGGVFVYFGLQGAYYIRGKTLVTAEEKRALWGRLLFEEGSPPFT